MPTSGSFKSLFPLAHVCTRLGNGDSHDKHGILTKFDQMSLLLNYIFGSFRYTILTTFIALGKCSICYVKIMDIFKDLFGLKNGHNLQYFKLQMLAMYMYV
jgi:hypothetical protein